MNATVIITGIVDGDLSGGNPKAIELYISGTEDLSNYTLFRSANGGAFANTNMNLTGTYTDEFVYLVQNATEFSNVFGTAGDFANVITDGSAVSGNGDDGFQIREGTTTIIDQVYTNNTSDAYRDSWIRRNDGEGPSATYDPNEWTFGGNDALDGLNAAAIAVAVPFGAYNESLPITLLSFTAERRGEQALIRWSTSAEEENDYMAVERSQDGVRFREIGRVSGAGTTDFVQRYSFLDEQPAAGLNYYRLRQVDFDGSFEYHRIATLDFRSGATVGTQVYPNPTKGDIFLSAQLADDAELLLLNTQGQVLRQFDASQTKAQNSLRTASLPAGVYFLRIASGGQAETLRFVKE